MFVCIDIVGGLSRCV